MQGKASQNLDSWRQLGLALDVHQDSIPSTQLLQMLTSYTVAVPHDEKSLYIQPPIAGLPCRWSR
jgi:hypothetical protein